MTVSFGRAKFKLDRVSAGLALESCLGGLCDDMLVIQLADRVFRFSVASRHVGFMIYAMKYFTCASFKCFFHLWGNGGPSWKSEFRSWQKECNEEWTLVSPNKKRTDHAICLLQKNPIRSALKTSASGASVKRKLSFATFMQYPLCQGYEFEATEDLAKDALQAGYDCPQIRRRAGVILSPSILRSDHSIQFGTTESNLADQNQTETAVDKQAPTEFSSPQVSRARDSDVARADGPIGPNDDDPFGINDLVDDMVYRVWKCGRCLSFKHDTSVCSNEIRCRSCFRYGHMRKDCFLAKNKQIWKPKKGGSGTSINENHLESLDATTSETNIPSASTPDIHPLSPPVCQHPDF
jgi:hypothetical protein